jgi:Tfp pilus assembly protein PilN
MKAVNLLPPDLRSAGLPGSGPAASSGSEASRIGAFAVLGVLAFAVLALAAYVLTANTVKDRKAELAQVTADTTAVTQRANALKPYADFQSQTQTRVQTVKDLAASRFDWEQALRDLARTVPGDVTLTSMSGSISPDSTSAGGGSSAASDSLRPAIGAPAVTLQGCAKDQRTVASLMSRLGDIRGVTRVALSKSDRPDEASTTSAGGSGSVGAVPGCRAKRAPSFSLVMFFERSTVPATVEDVSVNGTTASASSASSTSSAASAGSSSSDSSSTSSSASTTTG